MRDGWYVDGKRVSKEEFDTHLVPKLEPIEVKFLPNWREQTCEDCTYRVEEMCRYQPGAIQVQWHLLEDRTKKDDYNPACQHWEQK